jgi:hypothetical protein
MIFTLVLDLLQVYRNMIDWFLFRNNFYTLILYSATLFDSLNNFGITFVDSLGFPM